ncbi:C2 calcium-dependent domain-containing protein 4C-like [Rhinatrema bivittatum]|uniref:C2 calcium-dependent domain-containing protein 4C-like n=1 Tax=Rhinatrema bivittatum TaxID=194408 RepID=UPI00112C2E9B|nr:C2 calcium-dependent domain-containing protein 4C-like [Rhinatrema bivittatum]XP_029430520.1 C2 calcium-dependent domain-containing protein 4C-like [Rhinatrema bivittatum]XP_029430521.1 C2 calcium-dependent domain-containing protein 4C-like [Rhinatrema bivittatum]
MWFLDKLLLTAESGSRGLSFPSLATDRIVLGKEPVSSSKRGAAFPNVLTPDKIPEFCIPPKLTAPLGIGATAPHYRSTPNIPAALSEPGGAHGIARGLHLSLPVTELHVIQIESVDDAPADFGYCDEESTNADPQSQAALSLPHLPKAQTSYGFCTLLESPHTRRKESLFHSDPVNLLGKPSLHARPRSNTYCKGVSSPLSISPVPARLSPRDVFPRRQGAWDSDTTSSAESSPVGSPLLSRSPRSNSMFKTFSQERLFSRAFRKNSKNVETRNSSLSTEEGSSAENSPYSTRRASEEVIDSLASLSCGSPIFTLDLTCGRERFVGENTVYLDRGGILRLSAEYCPENKRLRVRLISAEGLYDRSVDPAGINCCVSLSLVPGKLQKQRSTIIRKSRNPIFNEDFFFDGVSEDDLYSTSLKIKAMNKVSSLKRDLVLGESELCLMSVLSL